MRHLKKNRKFGREKNQRKALLRSLATSLILYGKIRTTEAKARELRPFIEKVVTRGKSDTMHSRRILVSRLGGKTALAKLMKDIAPKYKERNGGYTRIIKLPSRASDRSPMAAIEFV